MWGPIPLAEGAGGVLGPAPRQRGAASWVGVGGSPSTFWPVEVGGQPEEKVDGTGFPPLSRSSSCWEGAGKVDGSGLQTFVGFVKLQAYRPFQLKKVDKGVL